MWNRELQAHHNPTLRSRELLTRARSIGWPCSKSRWLSCDGPCDRPPDPILFQTPATSEFAQGLTSTSTDTPTPRIAESDGHLQNSTSGITLPPWDIVKGYARLYLKHCNYQPLPLFSDNLIDTLSSRDPELLFAMMALASRFETIGSTEHGAAWNRNYGKLGGPAKELIMRRLACGPIELSTIQALCLLSMAEFNNGSTPQASAYSTLAMDLALSSGLSSDHRRLKPDSGHEDQERLRCYWSIVLLKNLYGSHAGTFAFVHDEKTPGLPESPRPPAGLSSLMTDAALEQPESTNNACGPSDLGVVAYVIQLSEIWQKSARYAHRRGKVGGLPPWSAQSDYAQITAELMDSETRLPYKYRFRPARFAEQDPLQLQEHYDFWASWILLQMLYHTVLCLLNHPLLLSLRLRNFRVTMVPEVFLQHTADLTATHTEWIVHLLDVCETKEFEMYNPFLAHSAAIAATVYLQQSYSENSAIRSTKQECFRKCVTFIRRLGLYWPYIEQLALKIEQFEQVVSASYRDPTSQQALNSRVFIDLDLFWEIIESSFVTELPQASKSYFGASLASYRPRIRSEEVLRPRLLPEPTRIGSEVSRRNDTTDPAPAMQLPSFATGNSNPTVDLLPPENGEASILAQNYFALGEDFVGNLDDWWLPRPST
ncbi:hypothetical protein PV04_06864 [Phialophora macrospora]|uniref:Xylanolytic transcriptional activator regulatory domain-containing protein n=1 Tax=Phialophora macrospora TaxID=1851006 RepID=A0A0D2DZP7_9EURO|nr:hypothetical protein PV04_06864 [Phialophora macrospora]